MKKGIILVIGFLVWLLPFPIQAQSQNQKDDHSWQDNPGLGDSYTVPESYYNSNNEPAPTKVESGTIHAKTTTVTASGADTQLTTPVVQTTSTPVPTVPQTEIAEPDPYASEQPNTASKSPEDDLGVITRLEGLRLEFEELKKGVTNPDDVAGYNGGFYIKSRDDKFKLKMNFRAQVKYSFNIAEDVEDKHSLLVRRAYISFGGNAYSPKLGYFFLMAPAAGKDPSLIGFDLSYSFHKSFNLHFWLDYMYITSGYTMSSGKLQFVNKAMADARYNFGDAVCVSPDGEIGKIKYIASMCNGIATGLSLNTNNEMAYSLRVEYNLLNTVPYGGGDQAYTEKPGLAIGIASGFGHMESTSSDGDAQPQARIMLGTSDLIFKFKGYSLKLAGYFRFTDQDQFTRAQNDAGFTVETGYFIIPKKFELALRASALLDDLTNAGLNLNMVGDNESSLGGAHAGRDVGGDSDNEYEFAVGLNYYFGQNAYNTKVQAQYSLIQDGQAGPDDLTNHIGQLQFTVSF